MTRHVAILAINDWSKNQALLDALKKEGITDLYLTSEKVLDNDSIQDNLNAIGMLGTLGFTVHGVITPSDLFWDISKEEFNKVNLNCEDYEALRGRHSAIHAYSGKLRDRTLNPRCDLSNVFPGAAFQEAAKMLASGGLVDIRKKCVFSTELSRELGTRMCGGGIGHGVKTLLLNLFLIKLPSWIGGIVVADSDGDYVKYSLETFHPLEEHLFTPQITMLHASSQTNYKNLGSHITTKNPRSISCHQKINDHIEALETSECNPLMRSAYSKKRVFKNLITYIQTYAGTENNIASCINTWLMTKADGLVGTTTNCDILTEHRNRWYGKNRPMLPTSSIRLVQELIFEHTVPNEHPKVNVYLEQIDVHIKTLERTTYNPLMSTANGKTYAFLELKILLKTQGTDENIEQLIETFLNKKASLDTTGNYTNKKLLSEHRFIPQQFFASETESSSMQFINSLKNTEHRVDLVALESS